EQAAALAEGRFLPGETSSVRELRPQTAALDGLVQRIRRMFEAQTEQLGLLRQQAHHDALTGLYLRQQFLAELASALARDDGPPRASLLLLRLQDLAGVNRQLGREATDEVLQLIAEALQPYTERVPGSLAGRLNGADFALWLPAGGVLEESSEALTEALQQVLRRAGAQGGGGLLRVAIGGAELARSRPLSQWFALADQALAEAEQSGGQASLAAVTHRLQRDEDAEQAPGLPQGEGAWRAQIEAALAQQRVRLLQYPVLDREGRLLHWECPLQLGLAAKPGAAPDFVSATVWLPMAQRPAWAPRSTWPRWRRRWP
ncbi:MAG: GGDEF domain-containing protein, partial [Inhella sp.]